MKPVKRVGEEKTKNYNRFDTVVSLVTMAWLSGKNGGIAGLSDDEFALAATAAAAEYAEAALRNKGVDRKRVAEVLAQGRSLGASIVDIAGEAKMLDMPPAMGRAGEILVSAMALEDL